MESKEYSRHPRFWIEDGNVQDTLYKVHRYFFKEYSPVFRDMFSLPSTPIDGASVEGETEENPIILYDEVKGLDQLLNVFYPLDFDFADCESSDWLSVLKLVHKYQMDRIRQLTTRHLKGYQNPVHMILASRLYGAQQELLVPALRILSQRENELTVEESKAFDSQDVLLITRPRSAVRSCLQRRNPYSVIDDEKYLAYFIHLREFEPVYNVISTDADLLKILTEVERIADQY